MHLEEELLPFLKSDLILSLSNRDVLNWFLRITSINWWLNSEWLVETLLKILKLHRLIVVKALQSITFDLVERWTDLFEQLLSYFLVPCQVVNHVDGWNLNGHHACAKESENFLFNDLVTIWNFISLSSKHDGEKVGLFGKLFAWLAGTALIHNLLEDCLQTCIVAFVSPVRAVDMVTEKFRDKNIDRKCWTLDRKSCAFVERTWDRNLCKRSIIIFPIDLTISISLTNSYIDDNTAL